MVARGRILLAPAVAVLVVAAGLGGCVEPLSAPPALAHLPTALLRGDPFPYLVVEVDHVAGLEPCPAALRALVEVLEAVVDKVEIRLAGPTPIPAGGGDYENGDLAALHRAHADAAAPPAQGGAGLTVRLHLLYLDGRPEAQAGGHAAGRTLHDEAALFVFKQTFLGVHRLDGGVRRDATCDVERAVVLHELGHALGLVNRGIPMLRDRESPDHAGHSTNPGSVMYPVLHLGHDGLLLQEPPRNFDADDYADLRAFRDGAFRTF